MDEQCQFPVAQIAPSLTCSILGKPHSGLVESLRILPRCFRKRMSDVSMQWPWLQFPHLSVFSIAQKLLLPSFFAQRSSLPPRMFSRDCVPPSAWTDSDCEELSSRASQQESDPSWVPSLWNGSRSMEIWSNNKYRWYFYHWWPLSKT